MGEELVAESLQVIANLVGRQNEVLVFNPLNWERSGVVRAVLDVPKALNLGSPRLFDSDRAVPLAIHRAAENKVVHFNPRLGDGRDTG